MTAVDTSTLIAFIQGAPGPDVERFQACLMANDVTLPPVVLTELLSEPRLPARHRTVAMGLPVLDLLPDYWIRTAGLRASLLEKGLKARLADALIAQSCLDHDVALLTRDNDFRHFATYGGLKLA